MKTRNLFGMAFSLTILASCSQYPTTASEVPFKNVVAAILPGDTVAYRLDSLIDFDWDKLIIIRPYYDKKKLKQECGILSKMPDSKIDVTEGGDEYLFIKGENIISHHFTRDKDPSVIIISARSESGNDMAPKCGIPNTTNTFIKLVSNANPEWNGKTFKIFLKE